MKIRIEYKNGIINVPASVTDNIAGATKTDLALILLLAKDPSVCDAVDTKINELAEALGTDRDDIRSSIAFWRGAGVLSADGEANRGTAKKPAPIRSIPPLSASDIERISKNSPERMSLLDACAQTLGRILNSSEGACLLALCDYLGVEDEYILLVSAYCARKGKKNVKYIEKTAISIYDNGIETVASLEEYLFKLEARDELESRLRRLIGAGDRSFTSKEHERLERWQNEYGFDFDMIKLAYEKTVDATGKASLAYMDKILASWNEKGFKTPDDVADGDPAAKDRSGSFDTDDFFSMAVKRGLKNGQ